MKSIFWILVFSSLQVFAQSRIPRPGPIAPEESMRPDNGQQPNNQNSVYSPEVRILEPRYSGNGCPAGTASITLSPDNKMLSVIMDQFVVEAGGVSGRNVDRKRCQFAIPFEVPRGMQVSLVRVDYRGFNSIPDFNSFTELMTTHQFIRLRNNSIGQSVSKKHRFQGPIQQEFYLSGDVNSQIFSPCGEKVQLNILSIMSATSNNPVEQITSTIDSIDAQTDTNVRYHLLWRQCR